MLWSPEHVQIQYVALNIKLSMAPNTVNENSVFAGIRLSAGTIFTFILTLNYIITSLSAGDVAVISNV